MDFGNSPTKMHHVRPNNRLDQGIGHGGRYPTTIIIACKPFNVIEKLNNILL